MSNLPKIAQVTVVCETDLMMPADVHFHPTVLSLKCLTQNYESYASGSLMFVSFYCLNRLSQQNAIHSIPHKMTKKFLFSY